MATVMELAHACASVYEQQLSNEAGHIWTHVQDFGNPVRGFFARLIRHNKTKEFALSVRGTNDALDVGDDVAIALGLEPVQIYQLRSTIAAALQFHAEGAGLLLTGHSLGGALVSLASLRAAEPLPLVTFNAPGMLRAAFGLGQLDVRRWGKLLSYRSSFRKALHIRSEMDLVSLFGPRITGKTVSLRNNICGRPAIALPGTTVIRSASNALCAHRMATVIRLLEEHPQFKEEIQWA